MATPLLTTKLYIPPVRTGLVSRPRLVERLKGGLTGKLTLISAPAGFGKTTLLSGWIPQSERYVAWLSLDDSDNDPIRFWIYFISALQLLQPSLGEKALLLLQSPQPPPSELILTTLLNELVAFPDDFALILDDYHLIESLAIHEGLTFMLDHLPPTMHLLITTRLDPPLPLSRLRSRGQLTEFRAVDLRFTPEEATIFLNEVMGLSLSAEAVAALESQIEGWIAGLQLAALSMQGRQDITGFIEAFTGSHRFILDYLTDEVLERRPKGTKNFLLQTSILDHLCAPLCDAVTGQSDGQMTLERLEQANLFIVALDDERRWYRYHHLFAEVLRARLQQAQPGSVPELYRRASVWYEQQGLLAEAITLAVAAADLEQVARLVEQHGPHLTQRGQVHTVLGWLNALPEALVRSRASLCLVHAQTLMFAGRLEAANARLDDAEQCIQTETPANQVQRIRGQVALFRAIMARFYGNLAHSVVLSHQALEVLPKALANLRTVALLNAARIYLVSGEVTPANEQLLIEAITQIRLLSNQVAIMTGLTNLARLQTLQGRLRQATKTYAEAAQVAGGPDVLRALIGSLAYYAGLGDLLREQNDLDEAERLLGQGLDATTQLFDADLVALCYRALAQLKQTQGDTVGAIKTLDEFVQLARQRKLFETLIAQALATRARLQLAQGNLTAALLWVDERGLSVEGEPSYLHELEYLALVRVRLAQGRLNPAGPHLPEALRLLAWLLPAAEASERMGSRIEILSLRALALQAQDDLSGALTTLERALLLAEPRGYVRLFVDEGAPMAMLLQEAYTHGITPSYASKLLAAFGIGEQDNKAAEERQGSSRPPQSSASLLVEPLSPRELELLHLVAAGQTNLQIAQKLFVAVGTVKKHLNNIFGKLEVGNRTQAIARARELDLL
jgi:LuxR family transcriptional regulator, maltose regulon positive regulatory protein